MSQNPQHYHLATATIFYNHEDKLKSFPLNSVFSTPSKKIKGMHIGGLQRRMMSECQTLLNIPEKDLLRMVFTAISYLGLMTEKEFHQGDEPAQTSH